MASRRNWELNGVPAELRALAEEAAQRQGLPLGEWLARVIYGQREIEREEDVAHRRQALERRLNNGRPVIAVDPHGPTSTPAPGAAQPQSAPTAAAAARQVSVVGVSGGGVGLSDLRVEMAKVPGSDASGDDGPPHPAMDRLRRILARGEEALLSVRELLPDSKAAAEPLEIERLRPNRFQMGVPLAARPDTGLVEWIRAGGAVPAILVRPAEDGHYDVITGLPFWQAAEAAGSRTVQAVAVELDDRRTVAPILIEALIMGGLNPIEEAESMRWLLRHSDVTEHDVARLLRRRRPDIRARLALLNLAPAIREMIAARELSPAHAVFLHEAASAETAARLAVERRLTPAHLGELVQLTNAIDAALDADAPRLESRLGKLLGAKTSVDRADGIVVIAYRDPADGVRRVHRLEAGEG